MNFKSGFRKPDTTLLDHLSQFILKKKNKTKKCKEKCRLQNLVGNLYLKTITYKCSIRKILCDSHKCNLKLPINKEDINQSPLFNHRINNFYTYHSICIKSI